MASRHGSGPLDRSPDPGSDREWLGHRLLAQRLSLHARCHVPLRRRGRGTPTSGSAILGPVFANRDYQTPSADWTWVGHVFRVPDDVSDSSIRLGHWQASGTIQYDAVRLQRVLPVHAQFGSLVLGDGEQIQEGRYSFAGIFSHEGSNYHRPLQSATASFNSDRWVFAPGQQVTYRFELPGLTFRAGQLSFNVNYHTSGGCTAQISRDGEHWQDVGTQSAAGTFEVPLPNDLLPALVIFLRLKSATDDTSLQVNRIEFSATLSDPPRDAIGQTLFAAVEASEVALEVRRMSLVSPDGSCAKSLSVELQNNTDKALDTLLSTTSAAPGGEQLPLLTETVSVAAGATATRERPLAAQRPGRHQMQVTVALRQDPSLSSKLTLDYDVPEYYRTDYGARLSDVAVPGLAVWWCPATHKVAPQRRRAAARVRSRRTGRGQERLRSRTDRLRADRDLEHLTARAADLVGPHGARLPADCVSIQRVAYHFVRHPTDSTGVIDFWPRRAAAPRRTARPACQPQPAALDPGARACRRRGGRLSRLDRTAGHRIHHSGSAATARLGLRVARDESSRDCLWLVSGRHRAVPRAADGATEAAGLGYVPELLFATPDQPLRSGSAR